MDFILSVSRGLPAAVSQGLIYGILAIGVYITYRILDFADLTVDSTLSTGGAVSAVLIISGMHPLLTLVFAIMAGMCAGAVTGFFNTKLGIQPILAGILTQLAFFAVNMRILGRANVGLNMQPTIISLGNIPMAILTGVIFAVIIVIVLYWFFGTEIGSAIRATGDNRKMVRAQGVNTNSMKMVGLIISNGLVGLAGALLAQYNGVADVNNGRGAIVIGLASVIVGEVVIGKKLNFAFKLAGIFIGSILYASVTVVVLQMNIRTDDLRLFNALVIATALGIPHLRKKYGKVNVNSAAGKKQALASGTETELNIEQEDTQSEEE